jgi:hypothetical protein
MLTFKGFIRESKEDHPDYKQAISLRDIVSKNRPEDAHHFNHYFDRAMKHGSPTHARDFARDVINGDIPMKDVRSRTYIEPTHIYKKAETEKNSPNKEAPKAKISGVPPKETTKTSAASASSTSKEIPRKVKAEPPKPQNVEVDPNKVKHIPQGVSGVTPSEPVKKATPVVQKSEPKVQTSADKPPVATADNWAPSKPQKMHKGYINPNDTGAHQDKMGQYSAPRWTMRAGMSAQDNVPAYKADRTSKVGETSVERESIVKKYKGPKFLQAALAARNKNE